MKLKHDNDGNTIDNVNNTTELNTTANESAMSTIMINDGNYCPPLAFTTYIEYEYLNCKDKNTSVLKTSRKISDKKCTIEDDNYCKIPTATQHAKVRKGNIK